MGHSGKSTLQSCPFKPPRPQSAQRIDFSAVSSISAISAVDSETASFVQTRDSREPGTENREPRTAFLQSTPLPQRDRQVAPRVGRLRIQRQREPKLIDGFLDPALQSERESEAVARVA